jgi:hypothetical protein
VHPGGGRKGIIPFPGSPWVALTRTMLVVTSSVGRELNSEVIYEADENLHDDLSRLPGVSGNRYFHQPAQRQGLLRLLVH